MSIYTLKETLQDRIKTFETDLDKMKSPDTPAPHPFYLGRLEGRLDEARALSQLVEQAATHYLQPEA